MLQNVTEEVLEQHFGGGYFYAAHYVVLASDIRLREIGIFEIYVQMGGCPAAKVAESINKGKCYDDRGVRDEGRLIA